MHLVSYHQDMNMCRYERNMGDIKETNEAWWLFQIVVQSEKQERNHTFSDKTTVWGAHYIIKISEDTE